MEKGKKVLIRLAVVFLISCIMQWHTAYAASLSQPESSDIAAVSDGEDAGKGTSGTEDPAEGGFDQNTNEELGNISDQNRDMQQETDQDSDIQQEEELNQDLDIQQEEKTDQDMEKISDGSQSDDSQIDQDQGEIEDDDEWADGDDEWTDAWTGVDEEIAGNEWADDRNMDKSEDKVKNKGRDPKNVSVDSIEPYDGKEGYVVEDQGLSVSSKSSRAALDQSYQTGAGLGNDIFLILAVVCGITAIGLSARRKLKN